MANWNDVVAVSQSADSGLALDTTLPGTVSGFDATDIEIGQVTLSWTNPVDPDLAEVLVLRKAGSYPTDHSDAGASVVYTGLGTGTVDTAVTEGVTYYYAAFTRDTNNNWNETVGAGTSDTGFYPDTSPATVTGFNATDSQLSQVTLIWTNPGDSDFAEVLVLRKPGSYPTSHTDGAATSVYSGLGTSSTDSTVTEGTTYYYAAFTRDNLNNWNDTVTASTSADTGIYPDTPPATATGFNATDNETEQVTLSWTNPSDADLDTIVVRKKIGFYPADHNDGSLAYQSAGSPVPGGFETVTDIETVVEGTTYYYAVFTSDALGNWNDTVAVSTRDTGIYPDTPPARVTDFDASDNQLGQVTLSWTNPGDSDLAEVRVLRKSGSYPTAHDDGSAITVHQDLAPTSGGSENTVDSPINEGTVYYYAVFGKDTSDNWNDTVTGGDNANTGTFPNTPPVISSIVHAPSEFAATITWDTDEPATSVVEYGLTASYGSSESSAVLVTSHSIIITGLDPGTEYHYRVTSSDANGNISVSLDRTFTTVNTLAPATVTDFNATDNQPSQVTLTWTNPSDGDLAQVLVLRKEGNYPTSHTDAGATQVFLNTSASPSGSEGFVDTSLVNETTYYYAVFTRDDVANWNDVVWVGNNADIGVARDLIPPVIVDIQVAVGEAISTITLQTDEPTTVTIDYASASDYAVSNKYKYSYSDPILSTSHSMDISSLDPGTNYHYSLTLIDGNGNAFATSDTTFTTLSEKGSSGGGCFIATAAYGSYEAPYVRYLRDFRDEYLLTNKPGMWFVKQYYTYSPEYADWLKEHSAARAVVRILLLPLIALAWFLTKAGLMFHLITIGLLTGVFVVPLRSRGKFYRPA